MALTARRYDEFRATPLAQGDLIAARALVVSLSLLYKAALDATYLFALEPYFSHLGFFVDLSVPRLAESYLLVLIPALAVPLRCNRPSDILVLMLFLISICPTMSLYGMRGGPELYCWFAVLAFYSVVVARELRRGEFPTVVHGRFYGLAIAAIGSIAVLAWIFLSGSIVHFNLNLMRVYEFREVVREELYVGFFGYLNQWAFRVFNIALIAMAVYRKKWWLLLALLGLQVFFFGVSSEKKVLFVPLLVFALLIIRRFNYSTVLTILLASVGVGIVTWLTLSTDNWLLYSLTVRRVLFVPAALNFSYFEFFSAAGHTLWSTGPLSMIFEYPFEESPALMISFFERGATDAWMNNGFLGASFMHFGYPGMIFFGLLIGLLCWLVDSLILGRMPFWLGLSIVIVPFFNIFTGADLTTALGTHGLGIGLLILWLLGEDLSKGQGLSGRSISYSRQ